jgi:hypothetical protein
MSLINAVERPILALHEVGEAFHGGQRARLTWVDMPEPVNAEVVSVLAGRIVIDADVPVYSGEVSLKVGTGIAAAEYTCWAQPGPGRVAFLSHFERIGSVQDRTWVRVPYFAAITFTDFGNASIDAVGLDISGRGLACIAEVPPPQRADVSFVVRAEPLETHITTEVTLVRMRETGLRSWVAAYEFVALEPADERALCEVIVRLTSREFAVIPPR